MSGFIWLDVVDETVGGTIVDATPGVKGVIKLTADLGGDADNPKVAKINGSAVPAGGTLITGKVLAVSGAAALSYSTLDFSNTTTFTGTILSASLPSLTNTNIDAAAAISGTKIAYDDSALPVLSATTAQAAIDSIKASTVATAIKRQTRSITTADLQGLGASLTGSINIGSALPANARLLGAEINTTQILAGTALSSALVTVQGSTDVAGSLITGASVLATGFIGMNGTNRYMSRGSQQITATFTLIGCLLNALTGGALTVNLFYSVVS